jgi:hypothetical protein
MYFEDHKIGKKSLLTMASICYTFASNISFLTAMALAIPGFATAQIFDTLRDAINFYHDIDVSWVCVYNDDSSDEQEHDK